MSPASSSRWLSPRTPAGDVSFPGRGTLPLYTLAIAKLPGVYWLNYFGPAFLDRYPELATVTGARRLDTGGALIRTTDDPWQPYEASVPEWQVELREVLGKDAFEWPQPNRALPSPDQHVAVSQGTQEMPWIRWEAKLAIENANLAVEKRAKKHTAARRRLEKALAGDTELVLAPDATEWSTSLDLEDWDAFAKHITRKLRGDFVNSSGRAAVAVIATAPLESEGSVLLMTQHGPARLEWLIEDVDTIDVYLRGAPEVSMACDEWFD